MTFAEIPIGARFKFQGDTYTKIAISMAREDTTRAAQVFHVERPYDVKLIKQKRTRATRSAAAFMEANQWLP
jgi:hypothetical protein